MTHPEITGPLGGFETCPVWVPAMDSCRQFARITLNTMPVHGFDQRANRVAKVRNVSNVGIPPQFNTRTRRQLWIVINAPDCVDTPSQVAVMDWSPSVSVAGITTLN